MPPKPHRPRSASPPSKQRKGSYHHGTLRRALIDAGFGLVEKGGATSLTLRAAARWAGVSAAAPYRHFQSRVELLAAVAEEGFRLLAEELRRVVAAHDQPAKRLGEAGIAYVVFAAAHPARYQVMFNPELSERAAYPLLQAAEADTRKLLLSAVEDLHEAGLLNGRDPDELSLAAWSSVHGLASLITNGYVRPARAEEIARNVARWVIPGFADMNSN